jgi:hypothetical protein
MEADELTTSILDDVFFIIKKCVKRAIGKLTATLGTCTHQTPAGLKKWKYYYCGPKIARFGHFLH